jgi:hypothetical protein
MRLVCLRVKKNILGVKIRVFRKHNISGQKESYYGGVQ